MTKPKIGDCIEQNGITYVVTYVMPILTPFKRRSQYTGIEGYTLGLVELTGSPA